MVNLIEKIVGKDIQRYVVSSKFCKITDAACSIEGKFGAITLDFSVFPNVNSCQLKLKKVSGNGLVTIINGDEALNFNVVSKVSEVLTIDLTNNKKIVLHRPASGIGFIELIGIHLFAETNTTYYENHDVVTVANKCVRKFIKVVGSRVFANEGSEIEANNILDIETDPPNMYKNEGNKVTFLGYCEIIKLSVEDYIPKEISHFLKPIQNISNTQIKSNTLQKIQNNINKSIVFDFKPKIHSQNLITKDVGVLDEGLSVGRYGTVNINEIKLNKNTKYTLIISGKNLEGNGRISIDIPLTNLKNYTIYLKENSCEKIPFTTSHETDYKLFISRGNASTGDVWISGISIAPYSVVFGDIDHFVGIRKSEIDIEQISKQFATIKPEKFVSSSTFNLTGVIQPITYSANLWINKIIPFFPKLKIKSYTIDKGYINSETDLLISKFGLLKPSKRIWLEEFQGDDISDLDLDILKNCEQVISSSLPNVQYLRNVHNFNVVYNPKIWPYTNHVKPSINKYVLCFNRNTNITKSFIHHYNKELPQLVIPGIRGNNPDYVTPLSDNLSYPELLGLIMNASAIVDLPICTHYMSAILDIAFIAGVPIITTNQWMGISKPQCEIVDVSLKDGCFCPDYIGAINALNKVINKEKKVFDMTSYNFNLFASIKTALGD